MQQNKVKVVVRRCAYVAILAFDFVATRALDSAELQSESFPPILRGPYILWFLNFLLVSAADFLREQPGWNRTKCWFLRIAFSMAIFLLAIFLCLLYVLLFAQGSLK